MKVRVLLFARLREITGRDRLDVELPAGATLADLWARLQGTYPALMVLRHPPLMARNQEYATGETALSGDDEVAFLPPVSGG